MYYPGVLGPVSGWGIKRRPICFTGAEARTMVKCIIICGLIVSASVGMLIGAFILVGFGAEGPAKLIGAAVGVVVGLVIGLYWTVAATSAGTCTCPPENFGFCINIIFMKIPGVTRLLPWPPFIVAARAQCGRLVPPGCP